MLKFVLRDKIGISGIAAAVAGSTVHLTDTVAEALEVCRKNCKKVGIEGTTSVFSLNWNRLDQLERESYDFVIGSEVLYISSALKPLAQTVSAALREGLFLCPVLVPVVVTSLLVCVGGYMILADAGRMLSDQFIGYLSDLDMDATSVSFHHVDTGVCVLKKLTIVLARKKEKLDECLQQFAIEMDPELSEALAAGAAGAAGTTDAVAPSGSPFAVALVAALRELAKSRANIACERYTYRLDT